MPVWKICLCYNLKCFEGNLSLARGELKDIVLFLLGKLIANHSFCYLCGICANGHRLLLDISPKKSLNTLKRILNMKFKALKRIGLALAEKGGS